MGIKPPRERPPRPSLLPGPPQDRPSAVIVACSYCGRALEAFFKYCDACGQPRAYTGKTVRLG